jgi:hypothetical protein
MIRTLLRVLVGISFVLGLSQCERDPSKDSDKPDLPLPIHPRSDSQGQGLKLEARLDGRYVRGVSIDRSEWSASGPGQEIALTFRATGMKSVKQFRIKVQTDPADAFDLAASRFASVQPFFAPGIDTPAPGQVETGAAVLSEAQVNGDSLLGTLTLKTGSAFAASTRARVRVVLFSIGPNSTTRDEYGAEQLGMGIQVNQP